MLNAKTPDWLLKTSKPSVQNWFRRVVAARAVPHTCTPVLLTLQQWPSALVRHTHAVKLQPACASALLAHACTLYG